MGRQEDILERVIRTDEKTQNIENHVKEIREFLEQRLDGHDKRFDSHATKIRALEKWRNWMAGAGAVLASVIGAKIGHG